MRERKERGTVSEVVLFSVLDDKLQRILLNFLFLIIFSSKINDCSCI